MPGKQLRCDHDGCEAVFPPAPIEGIHWRIRTEAQIAGWVSSRLGLYDVDDDSDRKVKDFCPEHVDDLAGDDLFASKLRARIDHALVQSAAWWKIVAVDPPEPLTWEKLQIAIEEIQAAPKPPVIERRGTTIYVDGVPTFELNMPLLVESKARFNLQLNWDPPTVAPLPGFHEVVREAIAAQLAEQRQRIIDVGYS